MKKLALMTVVLMAACGSKKDPGAGSATTASGSASATGSAPAAGSGSAPAVGSGSAPAGSGSDTAMAGSGSGSANTMIDDPGIKFDKLPDGWEAGEGKLDTFEAVNDSKFPVDNAVFVFEYGLDAKDLPADPKAYIAVLEKSGVMEKVTKNEKTPTGHYYESADGFRYVIAAGDKRINCGGSLYKNEDYNKIPKERDAVIEKAKKICQTAKL